MKMNHKQAMHLCLAGILTLSMTTGSLVAFADSSASQPITVLPAVERPINMPTAYIINDQNMIFNRLIMPFTGKDDVLFLPVKKIAEGLGYSVSWQAKSKTLTLKDKTQTFTFTYVKDSNSPTGFSLKDASGRTYEACMQLGSLYTVTNVFAESMGGVAIFDQNNALRIDAKRFAPQEASTLGVIDQIVQGKDGLQVLVKGHAFGTSGYDTISLALSMKTPVTLSNGSAVKLSELKVGDQIYVKYGMAVTKSLPPMGQAESVTVLKDESFMMGKVYFKQASVEKNGIAAPIYQLRVAGTNDYILTLAKDATITDAKGNVKTFDDIKNGSIVSVFTAPYAAMSYPAQTSAYHIIIQ